MRLKLNKFIALVGITLALSFIASNAYSQCAMCRATVESNVGTGKGNQEPASEVGQGLNTGILYLMAMPYLLIGTVGFLWYRYSRKKE